MKAYQVRVFAAVLIRQALTGNCPVSDVDAGADVFLSLMCVDAGTDVSLSGMLTLALTCSYQ